MLKKLGPCCQNSKGPQIPAPDNYTPPFPRIAYLFLPAFSQDPGQQLRQPPLCLLPPPLQLLGCISLPVHQLRAAQLFGSPPPPVAEPCDCVIPAPCPIGAPPRPSSLLANGAAPGFDGAGQNVYKAALRPAGLPVCLVSVVMVTVALAPLSLLRLLAQGASAGQGSCCCRCHRLSLPRGARRLHLTAPRNEAVVISGRKLARQIRQEARHEVEQWVADGNKRPRLSVVLVGENPASHSYVLNKTRAAADVGISSETILKPASITEEELLDLISKLNNDANVDGLLVQLPLPEHIDERKVCNAVTPEKDVDGFHVVNVGRMCLDQYSMLPATPWGVWEIIKRTGIPTLGKNVVVAGRSKNVGMPIAMLLHTDGRHERPGGDATVTISHRYTPKEQLKQHTILADIVVAAAGIPNLITADMIKEGAAVIDVGINRVRDPVTAKPKLVGDVDFEGVKQKASYITPVPGGVGPMTVAMLMKNTIIAAKKLWRPQEMEALSA
ncbi:bifunctional methylenetetrahydrofolate dehydrogenase/cyclohydrolase, mitochondrial [Rhineura floridana]|uniref:bifunctional methylenetetrahydrofolate dehydrogenase/cyclohydrolase, mitochondrial n=1 Tax=Rhineura floridana TaxID=261503 RepID=UPI002AC851D9|nr:bifunctional methylenetetrahydrofolate dehydrogenase/cyclohydrolase, mitochondrial [Rhineura floridana]